MCGFEVKPRHLPAELVSSQGRTTKPHTDKDLLSRGAPLWILMMSDRGAGSDFNPNAYCLAMPMIMHLGEDL
ncbi:hypothetical protein ANCDUO_20902, partial [Ancylostoma duodenale]